jgi:hypothetical protein
MKDYMKKTIVGTLTVMTLAAGVNANSSLFTYLGDTARSHILELTGHRVSGDGNFTLVDQNNFKSYTRTYRNAPIGFIHSGGILFYKAEAEISLSRLAETAIGYTDYYRLNRLARDIRKYNSLKKDTVSRGASVLIPGSLSPLMQDCRAKEKPEIVFTRGLYLTGTSAGSSRILEKMPRFKKLGINALVFDAKDITGIVTYKSRVDDVVKYNTHNKRTIHNPRKLIREMKKNGIYSIARIAVFHDHLIWRKEPSLAIRSRSSKGKWNPRGKEKWLDPTSEKVQNYNIKLAVELAEMGVDEIQFDYIRFPTTGNLRDAAFRYDFGKMKKEEVIAHFLRRARKEMSLRNTNISIDIFGVVAWGKHVDIRKTGQKIELLARHCDVISPMLYPSHFDNDFDGYARPANNPYYFIARGCEKVRQLAGKRVIIRPWLQAFKWRVSAYNKNYILKQVKASNDSGAHGYLFWSASNKYETVFDAMRELPEKK